MSAPFDPLRRLAALIFTVLLTGMAWLAPPPAAAQPELVHVQGRLVDGANLVNGNVNLTIRLFTTETGGSAVYTETQAVVPVVDGLFGTFLGQDGNPATLRTAIANPQLWLEYTVDGTRLSPRERFGSVVYALRAASVADGAIATAQLAANAVTSAKVAANSLTAADLAPNAVGASELANNAVRSAEVLDGSLTADDLAANSVGVSELAGDAVTSAKVAPNSLTAADLAANSVGTSELASDAVTNAKLANMPRGTVKVGGVGNAPTDLPTATAGNLLIGDGTDVKSVPISGAATLAANGTLSLANNSVGSAQVVANSLTAADLAANSVGASELATDAVRSAEVQNGSLTAADLASNTFWSTTGNTGTGTSHFLGTTDDRALTFRVNGVQALQIRPATIFGGTDPVTFEDIFLQVPALIGGVGNTATSAGATIGGGENNDIGAAAIFATVGGGANNDIDGSSIYSTVGGGLRNRVQDLSRNATVGGGQDNDIGRSAPYATVGGGNGNRIGSNAWYATVGGGAFNGIGDGAERAAVGGGGENSIGNLSPYATVGGGFANDVGHAAEFATVSGGRNNDVDELAQYATVGGGGENHIGSEAFYGTVGGGFNNRIGRGASLATVGGGQANRIDPGAEFSTIGGGEGNVVASNATHSLIGGGIENGIGPGSLHATISGGNGNFIVAGANATTVGGGSGNLVMSNAQYGAIAGGNGNIIGAGIRWATVPGGRSNVAAGDYSFAAGRRARAHHEGAWMWADSQDADFASTGTNQFLIRASGGVGINMTSPASSLHLKQFSDSLDSLDGLRLERSSSTASWLISVSNDDYLNFKHSGGNALFYIRHTDGLMAITSDRRLKKEIAPLAPLLGRVLALQPRSYLYKGVPDSAPKTLGFVAQEIEPFFPELVEERGGVKALVYGGLIAVTVAAVQELHGKVEAENAALRERVAEQTGQIAEQDDRIAEQGRRLAELEAMVRRLAGAGE